MATTQWALDPTHSEVTFKVRHMMISNVSGSIGKFDCTVETEGDNLETAKIHFTAETNSLTTNNEQRDAHLMSADFFDAANHPQIKFEGTRMEKLDDQEYKLHGNLTIRGITKAITLDVEHGGTIKDPYGLIRCGFAIEGRINRKDFGLQWHAVTEAGGLVVADDIKIQAHAEFTKK